MTTTAQPELAPQQNAVASPPKPDTVQNWLQGPLLESQVKQAMPEQAHVTRFLRCLFTQVQKVPKLMQCTRDSLYSCIIGCAQLGLFPDGRLAHLIPYGDKCTLIIDYKGLVELAYRTGKVSNIHADVVREGDVFEYSAGELSKHVPWFLRRDDSRPETEGDVYAFYANVRFRDGTSKCEALSIDEVEAIRKRSRAGNGGPWVTDFVEMGKKTSYRRLSKWIPLSPEERDAIEKDGDVIDITPPPQTREPLRVGKHEIPVAEVAETGGGL